MTAKKTATQKKTTTKRTPKATAQEIATGIADDVCERMVAEFNDRFPVGSVVLWRSASIPEEPFKPYKVRSAAYLNNGKTPVVFLEGKSGFVSIEPEFLNYRAEPDELAAAAASLEPAVPDDNAAAGDAPIERIVEVVDNGSNNGPRALTGEPGETYVAPSVGHVESVQVDGEFLNGERFEIREGEPIHVGRFTTMQKAKESGLFSDGELSFLEDSIFGPGTSANRRRRLLGFRPDDGPFDDPSILRPSAKVERAINESIDKKFHKIRRSVEELTGQIEKAGEPLPEPKTIIGAAEVLFRSRMFRELTAAEIAVRIMAGKELFAMGPIEAVVNLEYSEICGFRKRAVPAWPDGGGDAEDVEGAKNRSWGHLDEARAQSEDGDGRFIVCKHCKESPRDHLTDGGCRDRIHFYEAERSEPEPAPVWGDGNFIGDIDGGVGVSMDPPRASEVFSKIYIADALGYCTNCQLAREDHADDGTCPDTSLQARSNAAANLEPGKLDDVAVNPVGDGLDAVTFTHADAVPDLSSQPTPIDDQAERVAGLEVSTVEMPPPPAGDCPVCGLPAVLCDCKTTIATPEPTMPAGTDAGGDAETSRGTMLKALAENVAPAAVGDAGMNRAADLVADRRTVQERNADMFPTHTGTPPPAPVVPPPAFEAVAVPDERKTSGFYVAPDELPLPPPYPHNPDTWRKRIAVMCRHLGIDPTPKLEKFDACPTSPAKLEYYETVVEYYAKYWPDQLAASRDRALQG